MADSPVLAERITNAYGVAHDRVLSMPFSPSSFLNSENSTASTSDVLKEFGIKPGYFFYPAQIWPHKNHIRVLQALVILNARGIEVQVIFAGGDKQNRAHVEQLADQLNVRQNIKFLGFVPESKMRGLYDGCKAVLMPTYFGPTNIPPLEAWSMGKPLIYSTMCKEQAGDAAYLVDPDDADGLALAIERMQIESVQMDYVEKGFRRLKEIEGERMSAEKMFIDKLKIFARRRETWS
jgi:glycosyltransferase involved in cell wall biosynthesis